MFTGLNVALITPFAEGRVDEVSLRGLIEWLIGEGVDGLVPCGTTGEASTLSNEEYVGVIRLTVEAARKQVPVIAGSGANATAAAVERARMAVAAGAGAVDSPIVLYNVPGRTGVNLLPETVGRLALLPNIVGLKDASGSLAQATETLARVPTDFICLSGEDTLNYPLYAIGYRGAISAAANLLAKPMAKQWDAISAGDHGTAARIHRDLYAGIQALFLESNPIPVKTALSWCGKCREEFRLPLTSMGLANKEKLKYALKGIVPQ
ncbi:MAG: 4-hydroxy-tetrahydrodipicolinate synthase [Deltaproteobacteria bacterium]|nr:4-hydroxy-tetrahydrodipicolinate synthase [Deltaproteobacteria bacterium]